MDLWRGFIRSGKVYRRVKRKLKKLNLDHSYEPFSASDTAEAIKQSNNSTATGPEGLAPWHLKQLGPRGIEFLTKTFNRHCQNPLHLENRSGDSRSQAGEATPLELLLSSYLVALSGGESVGEVAASGTE